MTKIDLKSYFSNLVNLVRGKELLIITFVEWPVYMTAPTTYSVFLMMLPLSIKLSMVSGFVVS